MDWKMIYILFGIGVTMPFIGLFYEQAGDKRNKFGNILTLIGYSLVAFMFYPILLGALITETLLNLNKDEEE